MKSRFPKSALPLPLEVLRKAGYYPFTDPRTGEDSFVLRLGPDQYPRMHLYVEDAGQDWSFNLHIDQKKASYNGTSKHAGEYEGSLVEREMERISKWVAVHIGAVHTPQKPVEPKEKRGLFGGIFGG